MALDLIHVAPVAGAAPPPNVSRPPARGAAADASAEAFAELVGQLTGRGAEVPVDAGSARVAGGTPEPAGAPDGSDGTPAEVPAPLEGDLAILLSLFVPLTLRTGPPQDPPSESPGPPLPVEAASPAEPGTTPEALPQAAVSGVPVQPDTPVVVPLTPGSPAEEAPSAGPMISNVVAQRVSLTEPATEQRPAREAESRTPPAVSGGVRSEGWRGLPVTDDASSVDGEGRPQAAGGEAGIEAGTPEADRRGPAPLPQVPALAQPVPASERAPVPSPPASVPTAQAAAQPADASGTFVTGEADGAGDRPAPPTGRASDVLNPGRERAATEVPARWSGGGSSPVEQAGLSGTALRAVSAVMEPGQGKGDVPGAPVVRESAPAPAPAIAQAVSNSADPIVAIAAPAAGHGPLLSGPHAAAAPARTDSSMPAREVPDLPQQLVRAAHLQWRDGVGEARLRLNPEHLGEVTISLRVEQGAVLASVKAESASTLQLIQLRQQELQSGLETRGLHLDHLVLMTNADERRQRREYQPPRSPRPNRRNRDEDSPRFEVLA